MQWPLPGFICLSTQVAEAKQGLSVAITLWEGAAGEALQAPRGLLEAAQAGSHPMHSLEQQVMQLEGQVKQHTAELKSAGRYLLPSDCSADSLMCHSCTMPAPMPHY